VDDGGGLRDPERPVPSSSLMLKKMPDEIVTLSTGR
jgi:hypothetical protein